MARQHKDQAYSCKFTKNTRRKLKILAEKTKLSQASLIAKLIELEYENLKNTGWEGIYIQLDLFNDQPVDNPASLFDKTEDKVAV